MLLYSKMQMQVMLKLVTWKKNTNLKACKMNVFYYAAIFRKHKLLQQQTAKF